MPIDREEVGMADEAFDLHSAICRQFQRAVMDTAFNQAAADGCELITTDRMMDAARCVAESKPTYLEVEQDVRTS
jgi:hypothetical protein